MSTEQTLRQLSPRWAFTAQAIDVTGEPHLKDGVHLRIMPSHLMGLPAAPFMIYRMSLGPGGQEAGLRTDITWVDSNGAVRTPPFEVTPSNSVTGYLPPAGQGGCVWIEVDAEPSALVGPIRPPAAGVSAVRRRLAEVLRPNPASAQTFDVMELLQSSSGLRVDAMVNTVRGRAVAVSAVRPRYQLAATPIEQVFVSGRGVIRGVKWIDGRALVPHAQLWRVMGLPISSAARYAGLADAEVEAFKRVERGAPIRFGLHDRPESSGPTTTPVATDLEERQRIDEVIPPVLDTLKLVLNNMSESPMNLFTESDLIPRPGADPAGKLRVSALNSVLQASLDPGTGRWLGYMDRDEAPLGNPGDVVAYFIYGIWHIEESHLAEHVGPLLFKQIEPLIKDLEVLLQNTQLPLLTQALKISGKALRLQAIACATRGNPVASPNQVFLLDPLNPYPRPSPQSPTAWRNDVVPPDAERELVIPAFVLRPGATTALARRSGTTITGLNRLLPITKRAISIMPSTVAWATFWGTGTFNDRHAPPEKVTYRAAQTDWFGRWSDWFEVTAGAGVRPRPPIPSVTANYVAATIPTPMPQGPLSGTIRVSVPVPSISGLAPGANLLASLRIVISGAETILPIPTPATPPAEIATDLTGPPLERAATGAVTITAEWIDTAGVRSAVSPVFELRVYDPRPPVAPVLPLLTLNYSSRPDVTGRARVELQWNALPQHAGFRIFYADDSRLETALSRMVAAGGATGATAQTIEAALAATTTLPERANVFRSNAGFFDRSLFEQLTISALPNAGGSQIMRFKHELSGSLRSLSFYRIVGVSAAQVETPFAESPFVVFGVPNTLTPLQPLLRVEPVRDPPNEMQARLTITVPAGPIAATEYRLRRSGRGAPNPLTMPVVDVASIGPPSAPGQPQKQVVIDTGTLMMGGANFQPWVKYHWTVEVRGAPDPGGGPPAVWTSATAPVALMFVPPDPPAPPVILPPTKIESDIQLRMTHPDPLLTGEAGEYVVELYRRLPGQPDQLAVRISADATPEAGGRQPDRTGEFHYRERQPQPSAIYIAIVRDPFARPSAPSNAVTLT